MAKKFLRVENKDNEVLFFNPAYVVSIRPADLVSFDSGAIAEVAQDTQGGTYIVDAGKNTNDLIDWLGITD